MRAWGGTAVARFGWYAVLGIGMALGLPAQQGSQGASASRQSGAVAQLPALIPRSHDEREQNYKREHRIILNARVTDAQGRPIAGLTQQDFALIDGGKAREIASVREMNGASEAAPARVLLVLDIANSSSESIAHQRKEIERYLEENRGRLAYPVAISVLKETGMVTGKSSRDADALVGELRRFTRNAHAIDCAEQGSPSEQSFGIDVVPDWTSFQKSAQKLSEGDCLVQRFSLSVTALDKLVRSQTNQPGRAIVVWIGAGWPSLDGPSFEKQPSATRRRLFDYLADLLFTMQEAQVTLDVVAPPSLVHGAALRKTSWQTFANGVQAPDEASPADLALPVLSSLSGGQVVAESRNIAGGIAAAVADADSYYALEFDSPAAQGTAEFHSLEIKVDQPGSIVRGGTAYFTQP